MADISQACWPGTACCAPTKPSPIVRRRGDWGQFSCVSMSRKGERNMAEKEATAACTSRELVRHMVATLAYRGGKALRGAPNGFAQFRAGDTTRTPSQILAHIGDLLDWGLSLAKGAQNWQNSDPLPWDKGSERFFAALQALDAYLASESPLGCSV